MNARLYPYFRLARSLSETDRMRAELARWRAVAIAWMVVAVASFVGMLLVSLARP